MWGECGNGSLYVVLENVRVDVGKGNERLFIATKGDPKGNKMFLQLYNFNNNS